MEDENIFIDNFIKKEVKFYREKPNTSWEDMQIRLKQNDILSKSHVGINKSILIISGLAVITVAVWFAQNNGETETSSKQNINNEIIDKKTEPEKNNILILDKQENKTKDTTEKIHSRDTEKNTEENKTVKIKVKVPVHKKVIIKKQVFVKDTAANN